MKHISISIVLFFITISLNGCGIAIKGVAETAIGPTCDLLVIESIQDLRQYDSIMIKPFTSSVGGNLNEELLAHLNKKVANYSTYKNLEEQNKELQLSGTILHLTDGIYEKQILLQLKFHDTNTDSSLGLINVMGEANTIRGLKAVMDSLANSVRELLAENNFHVQKARLRDA